jgi:predicted GIY-YIG superfamily endonuclease
MLYILHFEPAVSGYSHYVGACGPDRLKDRLIEHARGRGASLTQRAIKAKSKIYLARTFPEMGYEDEKRIKRASHFKDYCPLCCPLLFNMRDAVYEIDACRPEQPPPRAIWDWRPSDPPKKTSP